MQCHVIEEFARPAGKDLSKVTSWNWLIEFCSIGTVVPKWSIPVNTKRNKHAIIMTKRRFYVIITCSLHCVFAGMLYLTRCLILFGRIYIECIFSLMPWQKCVDISGLSWEVSNLCNFRAIGTWKFDIASSNLYEILWRHNRWGN